MDRYKMLPSYHYVENEDGVINNPATDKLRTCTIYGNHGKNLIPFPYVSQAGTQKGVTITVDSDGVITLNGTSTESIYFGLLSPVNSSGITKPGKYTISGLPAGTVNGISIQCYVDGSWGSNYTDFGNGSTFTVTSSIKYVTLQISGVVVCDNVVIKPMLEEGETKTEFEPWCGVGDKTKNLIPYPYANTTETLNGVTFTDNGDGSITVNGTATDDTLFFLKSLQSGYIRAGTYTLTGCPKGGSATTYCQVLGSSGYSDFGNGITRKYKDDVKQNLFIKIYSGYTANNLVFNPMLELGNAATEYEPYGYKIPVANDTRENLLNVEDCTATQTNSYYASISIQLTDSNMSTYLPYLDEMKGKTVQYSCDLDNENFRQELLIYYNVEVNGAFKYIQLMRDNNFTATIPDATPIRIEFRARSGSAEFNGTTVKFSNISLKLANVDPEINNLYIDNQIMEGESVFFKEDDLKTINLSKQNILSVESTVKPSSVSYTYYTY